MKSKVSVVILFCFLLMLSLFPFAPSHTSASDETIIEPVPNTWGNIILPDTSVNDSIVFGYDHYTNRSTISAIKFIVPYDVSEAIFEFTTYNGYIDSWLETMILQLGDDNWVAGGFPASYSDGPKVEIEYDELAATEKPGGNEYESTYSINVTELLTPSNIGADREVTFVISGTYPYLPGESIDIYLYNYPPLLPKLKVKYGSMNAAPEIGTIANQSIPEKEFFSLQVPASDENNDELSYSLIDPPSGVQIDSDGLIEWTPTEEQDGVYTIRVQVTDGKADPVEAQFTITVNEVNSAPVLDDIEDQIIDEETLLSFTATAEDEDRVGAGKVPNELAFSLAGSPPAGAAITSAGLFTWTPTEAQGEDSYPITIRVIDQFGGWDEKSFTVTVNETNAPPSIELIVDKEVDELDILSFPVTANDPDPNPNLTYSLVGLDEKTDGAAIDPDTGVFSWTPTEEQDGVHTITVQVSDGTASAQEQFTVTVNEVNVAPELAPIGNKEIDEETLLSFTASATDSDLVGTEKVPNTLTYSIVGIPHTGAEIDSSTGVFTWTPSELYGPGDYNFVIRVADDGGLYDEETIVVKVNEINAPPSLDLIGDKEVDELDTLSFTVTANDPDPDPKPALTYSLVILDEEKSSGATIDKDTGEFSWTPTESQDGTHSFQIIVSDGSLTDEETITVTVNELNATPVLAVIEDQEIGEGEPLDVTATATDSDEKAGVADSLTYSLVTAPTNASINSGTGVITWIPEEDQDGPHVFRVRVSDGSGATAEGEFEVLVQEVNELPELTVIEDQEINEEELFTFIATATDVDVPVNQLTYSLADAPEGASIDADSGEFTWTPTEAQGPGSYTFKVVVSDSTVSVEQEVTLTVREVNTAPVLDEIDDRSLILGDTVKFTAKAYDRDEPSNTLTYSLIDAPEGATINSETGEFTFKPSSDRTYIFKVQASDGELTDEQEVNVKVFPPSPYVPEEILIEVLVNGKVQSIGKATVAVVNGQRVITITVDEQKLDQRLAEEGDNPVITILVNTDDTGVVIGQLSGSMIEKLNNKNAVIVIQTNDSSYSIPAKQLNLSAITSKLGSNVDLKNLNFKIEIAKPLKEMSEAVEKAVKDKGLTLAMEPLSFKITAHYGGKVVEVSSFNVYVERRVTIPAGVDPNRITTAVVIEEDGTIRHVPTQIIKQNNGHEAVINSLTNSTYALIWNPVQFIDVANHWAKDAINNMGSRLIVNGNGTGMYQPDQDITRAEFAAIVVRGLGLRISTSDSSFTDVNASDWYNGAIQTAYEYGLINGFEDGTFRPTESITREQAMLIISKAMKITELQGADSAQATDIVTAFADAAAVSNWAVNGVADSVSAGIITGRNNQWLAPKANITRAEVAMILQRLLQKSELID